MSPSFFWCLRRELWENRSIVLGPLAAAVVFLLGFAVTTVGLPRRMAALELDPSRHYRVVVLPYSMAATAIILTTFVVAAVYCLDALYGERRDRSILFWKSLPVSDLTTVLAKAAVPLAVLPALALVVSLATQLCMLVLSTVVLIVSGVGAGETWTRLPLPSMSVGMVYGVAAHALWHAPLYAWLLLVSAWARRTPLLFAVLPALALGLLERAFFQSAHVVAFLKHRAAGAVQLAFTWKDGRAVELEPLRFFTSPGLWLGLLAAAAFLAVAIRLRRSGEPI